jgi:hypothetical protein
VSGAYHPACPRCDLAHGPGELFVVTDVIDRHRLVVVETCELQGAWAQAHATPQPKGAVAYHATSEPEDVLARGLDPERSASRCKHVCLAETAWIAAGVGVGDVVLEVNVSGLDLFFELGEARHHGSVIAAERLRVVDPQPAPVLTGWSDPGWRRNHSDCVALLGLPLSRRLLNAAEEEMRNRWPWDDFDEDRFRAVIAELAGDAGPGGEPNALTLPTTRPRRGR